MTHDIKVQWTLLNLPYQPVLMTFYWRIVGTGAGNAWEAANELWEMLQFEGEWFVSLSHCLPITAHFRSVKLDVQNGGTVQSFTLDGTKYHGTRITLFSNEVAQSVQGRINWLTDSTKKLGYTQIPWFTENDVENGLISPFTWPALNTFAQTHATHLVGSLGDDLMPSIPMIGHGLRPIRAGLAMRTVSRQLHRRDKV